MQIPVAEIPGLQNLIDEVEGLTTRLELRDEAHNILVERVNKLEKQLEDTRKAHGTVLSGLLPGGMMHDRIAETRAAVKALADSPESPHHAATQSLMRLNWGQMSVEE